MLEEKLYSVKLGCNWSKAVSLLGEANPCIESISNLVVYTILSCHSKSLIIK